jgi:hypothetical protein
VPPYLPGTCQWPHLPQFSSKALEWSIKRQAYRQASANVISTQICSIALQPSSVNSDSPEMMDARLIVDRKFHFPSLHVHLT